LSAPSSSYSPATGLNILVVDDDVLVSGLIEDMLSDIGHRSQTAQSIGDALRHAREGAFDMALLDINLAGEPTFGVADVLSARGIPYAFVTGYGADGLDAAHRSAAVLHKPFLLDDMVKLIARLKSGR
jgi:DNA-binding NtrC family response regulator